MSLRTHESSIGELEPPMQSNVVSFPGCALRDPNLLGNDLRVWAALLFLSNGTGRYDGGLDQIAEWTALSTRTTNRSLRRLISMGYITTKRRQRQNSLITIKAPHEVYGAAAFDPNIRVPKIIRRRRGACPARKG